MKTFQSFVFQHAIRIRLEKTRISHKRIKYINIHDTPYVNLYMVYIYMYKVCLESLIIMIIVNCSECWRSHMIIIFDYLQQSVLGTTYFPTNLSIYLLNLTYSELYLTRTESAISTTSFLTVLSFFLADNSFFYSYLLLVILLPTLIFSSTLASFVSFIPFSISSIPQASLCKFIFIFVA